MIKNIERFTSLILIAFISVIQRRKFCAVIDVTDACGLSCEHCYHRKKLNTSDEVEISEWRRRFAEYKSQGLRCVILTGGEPSLRIDVIRLAAGVFDFVSVFTNGNVFIPEDIRCRIYLSLDGKRPEHDRIRGQGSFNSAVSKYSGDKRVTVYTVLSARNFKGVDALLSFIDEVKAFSFRKHRFEFFIPEKGAESALLLSKEKLQEIVNGLPYGDARIENDRAVFNEQIKASLSFDSCCIRKQNLVFDLNGNEKACVNPDNDCSLCRADKKVSFPIYQPLKWIRLKINRMKYFL